VRRIHTCTHRHIQTRTRTQCHAHTQTDTHKHTQTDAHTDTYKHGHTQCHAHTQTDTHKHTHTQTHTHTHELSAKNVTLPKKYRLRQIQKIWRTNFEIFAVFARAANGELLQTRKAQISILESEQLWCWRRVGQSEESVCECESESECGDCEWIGAVCVAVKKRPGRFSPSGQFQPSREICPFLIRNRKGERSFSFFSLSE